MNWKDVTIATLCVVFLLGLGILMFSGVTYVNNTEASSAPIYVSDIISSFLTAATVAMAAGVFIQALKQTEHLETFEPSIEASLSGDERSKFNVNLSEPVAEFTLLNTSQTNTIVQSAKIKEVDADLRIVGGPDENTKRFEGSLPVPTDKMFDINLQPKKPLNESDRNKLKELDHLTLVLRGSFGETEKDIPITKS